MGEDKKGHTRYRTANWGQYNAALKARASLTMWLDRRMQWLAAPSGKRRRRLGMVRSLLQLAPLGWPVPGLSTVCRRQNTSQVRLIYRPSTQPLNLQVGPWPASLSAKWWRRNCIFGWRC